MAIMNFNYSRAISQAQQIESAADEISGSAGARLRSSIGAIGQCWQGDLSTRFTVCCKRADVETVTLAADLRTIARRMREVARIIKAAEEEALARQRRAAAAAAAAAALAALAAGLVKPVK